MQIQLPDAGLQFISNFLASPFLLFLLLIFLSLSLLAFREEKKLFQPVPGLNIGLTPVILALILFFLLDFSFTLISASDNLYYLLFRNTTVFAVIILAVFFKNRQQNKIETVLATAGRFSPVGKLILFGAAIFLLLALFFWLISFLFPYRVVLSKTPPEINKIWQSVFILLLIPLLEELMFRAGIYRAFRKKWGVTAGIIFSSLLFAILHGLNWNIIFIFGGAMLMTTTFELTGSIIPALIIHSGFNFLLTWGHIWL